MLDFPLKKRFISIAILGGKWKILSIMTWILPPLLDVANFVGVEFCKLWDTYGFLGGVYIFSVLYYKKHQQKEVIFFRR